MAKATNKYKKALLDIIGLMANDVDVECWEDTNTNSFVQENILNTDVTYKDAVVEILLKNELAAEDFEHILSARTKGSGDYDGYEVIIRVKDELYTFDGYYSSWNGTDMEWNDCYQVEETEETITVYKKLK